MELQQRESIVQLERELAEETTHRETLEGMYHKVVSACLRCDPIPACEREDDELEPPWEVIDRVKSQRDRLAEAVESFLSQGVAPLAPLREALAAVKGGAMSDAAEYCECHNWCRDGRDMYSSHHPRCEKYTPPPADPRFARFGESMWKYITKLGGDFCGEEISEDILPLAQSAGLCCQVAYDPDIHGEIIDAEPGDEIWWWGAALKGGTQ